LAETTSRRLYAVRRCIYFGVGCVAVAFAEELKNNKQR